LESVVDPATCGDRAGSAMSAAAGGRVIESRVYLYPGREEFFRYAHGLKYRLCFGIPIASFLGEFGIYEMLEFPAGFEPALPP